MSPSLETAVVGIGQSSYVAQRDDVSLQELIFEAASYALDDAGIARDDVDSVVLGSQDVLDGRGISSMSNAGPAGAYMKDEIRVADDGIYGVILAALQVAARRSEVALVVSWSMASETVPEVVSAAEFDPFYVRPIGLSEVDALALQATAHSLANDDARRAATESVIRDRAAGVRNRRANAFADAMTAAQIERAPVLSWPLTSADVCPATDGACAVVVASAERALQMSQTPAWIHGFGWSSDVHSLGDRDLTRIESLRTAASDSYAQAAVAPSQLDVIEISTKSSFQEALIVEALGLCEPGDGARYVIDGAGSLRQRPVINPSGGTRSAFPAASAGLDRLAEAARQIGQRTGDHQVDDARLALAHGSSGQCLQSNAVVILGRDRRG